HLASRRLRPPRRSPSRGRTRERGRLPPGPIAAGAELPVTLATSGSDVYPPPCRIGPGLLPSHRGRLVGYGAARPSLPERCRSPPRIRSLEPHGPRTAGSAVSRTGKARHTPGPWAERYAR